MATNDNKMLIDRIKGVSGTLEISVFQEWLDLFGRGEFVCGSKYLCFKPAAVSHPKNYIKIAQAAPGSEDQPEWTLFADAIVQHLNALKRDPNAT